MDRNTMSYYGWIVAVVLVLSIMISLAAPFAGVIRDRVVGMTNKFMDKSDGALDSINGGSGGSGGGEGGGGMVDPDPEGGESIVVTVQSENVLAGTASFTGALSKNTRPLPCSFISKSKKVLQF